MDEVRMKVNEGQLDAMAGRVAELERQLAGLIRLLSRESVAEKLGLDGRHFSTVTNSLGTGSMAKYKHAEERSRTLDEARRDQFISRIEQAEAFASLSLQSFPEAWEAMNKDADALPYVDHRLVPGFKKKGRARRERVANSKRARGR